MSEQKIAEIGCIAHTLSQQYDKLVEENRKLREERDFTKKSRDKAIELHDETFRQLQSAQQEIERLKRQDNDVIISYALEKQKLIEGLKAIEKYLASGGDFKAWQMAHDLLQEIGVTVE